VLYDRDYCPIVRIRETRKLEIVPPLEWIRSDLERRFYDDATAPNRNTETLRGILILAERCTLEREIQHRNMLSGFCRGSYKEYASKWVPR
jgi:hypothetical protein